MAWPKLVVQVTRQYVSNPGTPVASKFILFPVPVLSSRTERHKKERKEEEKRPEQPTVASSCWLKVKTKWHSKSPFTRTLISIKLSQAQTRRGVHGS